MGSELDGRRGAGGDGARIHCISASLKVRQKEIMTLLKWNHKKYISAYEIFQ